VTLSGLRSLRKIPVVESLDVSMITPSGVMGGARQAMVWEEGNIRRWIAMGIRDGEHFLATWSGLSRALP
jgi:hypothetical protein